jgi:type IV secretion system protein VirB10
MDPVKGVLSMTPSTGLKLISPRTRLLVAAAAVAGVGIAGAAIVKSTSGDRKATIPAGTTLVGALKQAVSTKSAEPGDVVVITTKAPLVLSDEVTIPSGIELRGQVTYAKGGGRIAGAPELTLRFTRLDVDGHRYDVTAEPFRVKGTSDAKESALEIAGGTVAGAVVGKVTGSVVRGAVVGAAIGTGVAVLTKGDQIVLPAGQRLRVRLTEPVTVKYSTADRDA